MTKPFFLHRAYQWFMNLNLMWKMILGYLFMVFIPVLGLGIYFYTQVTEDLLARYEKEKQEFLELSVLNFGNTLLRIELINQLFQYNAEVNEFLNGFRLSESDEIYLFNKYVYPLMSFVELTNPMIESHKLYKRAESDVSLDPFVLNYDALHLDPAIVQEIMPTTGKWIVRVTSNGLPEFFFYQKLYTRDFSKEIGMIEIQLNNQMFNQFSSEFGGEVLFQINSEVYQFQQGIFLPISSERAEGLQGNSAAVNYREIDALGVGMYYLTFTNDVVSDSWKFFFIGMLLLFLLLYSGIYTLIAASVTRRVIVLARHIRKVDRGNLVSIPGEIYHDEIGLLMRSFNGMISRIDNLVNTVHQTEIKRREAAYRALQAQIQPHFLYNTLETIRMMAKTRDSSSVADTIYTLGQFLRYNLSKPEIVTLQEEVQSIEYYLKIHKIRMGERLSYSIQLDETVEQLRCPKFILQPIVENSVVHGLSNLRRKGRIEVSIHDAGAFILARISDNGAGIEERKLKLLNQLLRGHDQESVHIRSEQSMGIGISNVNSRVKTHFGEESGIEIYSQSSQGIQFTIRMKKPAELESN